MEKNIFILLLAGRIAEPQTCRLSLKEDYLPLRKARWVGFNSLPSRKMVSTITQVKTTSSGCNDYINITKATDSISTLVVCQTPCPSHLTCGNQTQHAYNKANGNIQLQCNALYEGLQCLETAECPQEYKVGLAEALTFAKQELQDLNCTHASTTIARTENTGFSLCPVWGMMFLAALIVTCPGHLL